MSTFINCIFVGLGGLAGSVARYLLGLIPVKTESGFPFITLGINLLGSFCIGIISAAARKYGAFNEHLLLLLKVGICGGFTTFSTFSLESFSLFERGRAVTGLYYITLSILMGLAAVWTGEALLH